MSTEDELRNAAMERAAEEFEMEAQYYPFGYAGSFTHDDVAACFHAAALVGYPDNRELPPSLARLEQRLIDLARRIEALLPPEPAE